MISDTLPSSFINFLLQCKLSTKKIAFLSRKIQSCLYFYHFHTLTFTSKRFKIKRGAYFKAEFQGQITQIPCKSTVISAKGSVILLTLFYFLHRSYLIRYGQRAARQKISITKVITLIFPPFSTLLVLD